MIKLCVFDFDSTLMDGETITFLAAQMGAGEEVRAITKRAMAGELDFFESLRERVAKLKGMRLDAAREVCEELPFISGAKELIAELNARGVRTMVFSGGFHLATDAAQKKLGFGLSFANELHSKEGVLTGLVGGEMMFSDSKGKMLARVREFLGLSKEEICAVGDGANDVSMFKEAGRGVAFCANEVLKRHATACVEKRDLTLILPHILQN